MTRWQTTIRGSDAICWGSFVTPTYELGLEVVRDATDHHLQGCQVDTGVDLTANQVYMHGFMVLFPQLQQVFVAESVFGCDAGMV